MNKVRQALDRARQEREELLRVSQHAVPPLVERATAGAEEDCDPSPPSAALARAFAVGSDLLNQHRVLLPDSGSRAAQAFRMLRTQVLQRMRDNGWRSIGVVSARSMDGKTTVAANLAIAIASDPRQTAILVDLDLQRPAVAKVFGATTDGGIDDVLHERTTVDAVMLRPVGFDGLRLLPVRTATSGTASALVARPACEALLAELRNRYTNRIIVVDMPPILDNDDALTLAPLVDCLLFVVSEGRTARADVTRALTLLAGRPVIGTVLNNCATQDGVPASPYG